jgi:hypothetical protein
MGNDNVSAEHCRVLINPQSPYLEAALFWVWAFYFNEDDMDPKDFVIFLLEMEIFHLEQGNESAVMAIREIRAGYDSFIKGEEI